jgi:hypothetical protein
MMLKPSLSFAGPREYRWQGLEVPVMMGKRRGTAQIATASPAGRAASNRHKNLLFSQLARSLCTPGESMILKPSLSFAGPREYRWQGLKLPVMMGKRRGAAQIATASLRACTTSNRRPFEAAPPTANARQKSKSSSPRQIAAEEIFVWTHPQQPAHRTHPTPRSISVV